jgi:hypothetical protein
MRMLNLGCGSRFSKDPSWTNLDVRSSGDGVIRHDLRDGIPFADESFDGVYLSHVLEHFARAEGAAILRECRRVLTAAGIVRVVVPDLEDICRTYLRIVERMAAGDRDACGQYDWILLEMYDQAVRTEPGGEMGRYLRNAGAAVRPFIVERFGALGREIDESGRVPRGRRAASRGATGLQGLLRWAAAQGKRIRRSAASVLLDQQERLALQLGLFRQGGEIHRWMYDQYSLGRLLGEAGFVQIVRYSAHESGIERWHAYALDLDAAGSERVPHSLYMEGAR